MHVSWDMFIERVNLRIRRHVAHHASRDHLTDFPKYFTFTDSADTSVSELLDRAGYSQKRALKEMDAALKTVVDSLNDSIGTTFCEASHASVDNLMGVDLSK
eukprot:3889270-Pleurochrysis_carterae.AAC.1